MGRINQGILGGFSGKVGNVVGGSWKGIDYMRVKPASVANPRTEDQVTQRNKFTVVLEFLQPVKDFVKVGLKNYANKMTEFNYGMSYNLKNAVTGTFPNFSVDYANVLISRGSLAGALNPTTDLSGSGFAQFAWDDNSSDGNASPTDKAMLMVYNPDKKEAIFTTAGVDRNLRTETLSLPSSYSGDTVHTFIAFVSYDGRQLSNSQYIGSTVAA